MSIHIATHPLDLTFERRPSGIEPTHAVLEFVLENRGDGPISLQLQLEVSGSHDDWVTGADAINQQVQTIAPGEAKRVEVMVLPESETATVFSLTLVATDVDAISADEASWSASIDVVVTVPPVEPKPVELGATPKWVLPAVSGIIILLVSGAVYWLLKPPGLNRVEVLPAKVELQVDEEVTLTASGLTKGGKELDSLGSPRWITVDDTVVKILDRRQASTPVRCIGLGRAKIEASFGGDRDRRGMASVSCVPPLAGLALTSASGGPIVVGQTETVEAHLQGKLGTTTAIPQPYTQNWATRGPIRIMGSGASVQVQCTGSGEAGARVTVMPVGGAPALVTDTQEIQLRCSYQAVRSKLHKVLRANLVAASRIHPATGVVIAPDAIAVLNLTIHVGSGEARGSAANRVTVDYDPFRGVASVTPSSGVKLQNLGASKNNPMEYIGTIPLSGFREKALTGLRFGDYVAMLGTDGNLALLYLGDPILTANSSERTPYDRGSASRPNPADLPVQWVLLSGTPQ